MQEGNGDKQLPKRAVIAQLNLRPSADAVVEAAHLQFQPTLRRYLEGIIYPSIASAVGCDFWKFMAGVWAIGQANIEARAFHVDRSAQNDFTDEQRIKFEEAWSEFAEKYEEIVRENLEKECGCRLKKAEREKSFGSS